MRFRIFYVLVSLLCVVFISPSVNAEEPDAKGASVTTDRIVVTAKRIPASERKTASNVRVYTREDLDLLPARDLTDALGYIPGIDTQLNGQFGQATSLSINGSKARQVLLMIDGVPFNTQLSGQASPSQIPLEHIERIEIIKGDASSAWGSSLGGVVNVITRDVGDSPVPTGDVTATFAEFKTTDYSLTAAGSIKDIGYFTSASFFNTDGPQTFSEAQTLKGFGKVSVPVNKNTKLTGSFGFHDGDREYALASASTRVQQPYETQYGNLTLSSSALKEGEEELDYQWNATYKYNYQDIVTDITMISNGALASSTVSSNVYHVLSLNGSKDFGEFGELVAGVDLDWHTLKSNRFLDKAKDISMQAPYLNYTYPWNNFDFSAGIRFDNNDQFGSQTSPSFGAVYHLDDPYDTLFRAKVSRGFNAPPLLWIFNNDPAFLVGPNPDLKAERSMGYQFGVETHPLSSVDLELNYFLIDIKDAIALTSSGGLFIQENFRKFRRQGVELLIDYRYNDRLSFYGSGAFTDVENRTTGQTVRDQGVARQSFTFGAKYQTETGFAAHLTGFYKRWSSSPSQANDHKPMFDAKFTKQFNNVGKYENDIILFFTIHNITNSKYWSSPSFPYPERYFEGGITVRY